MLRAQREKVPGNGKAKQDRGDVLRESEALVALGYRSRNSLLYLRKKHLIGFYKSANGVIRYSRKKHIEPYLASIEHKPRKRVRRGRVRDDVEVAENAVSN